MKTKKELNILMVGDIFGAPGRKYFANLLPTLREKYNIDFVVVNGENTTHGKSISRRHYNFYKNIGVDVITSGNHIYKLPEVKDYISETPDLLRPLNFNTFLPGNGTVEKKVGTKTIRVTNLLGRVFMDPAENQYAYFDKVLKNNTSDIHLVDIHAEATAEKKAFAWYYDGRVTAVVGTHTHVLTDDASILPKGTAFITDLGMTGPINSIIGAKPGPVIRKERYGLFSHFSPAEGPCKLTGVIITIDFLTNKATNIQTMKYEESNA